MLKNRYMRQRAADHLGVSLSAISRWVKAEKGPTGSRYFCESLFWASQPKQATKT
ncbi:MAG TPA: hypothetical protein EYQ43_09930 [Methyloprofundus sp.]|nr:hypothetical protein [Methyloprofundus sp.]